MIIIQPPRNTFWKTIFLISAALPWLSIWQSIQLAHKLEVNYLASVSWMGFLVGLFVLGLIPLLAWTLTWSRYQERILSLAESPERAKNMKWLGWVILIIGIIGFTVVFTLPFVQKLFGKEDWIRLLVFWYFSLLGVAGLKIVRQDLPWFTTLLSVVLIQAVVHLLASQFSYVTGYPFSMGWSEASRYYHPSLFVSNLIYGHEYPLPIINSSLHLILMPPYLLDLPLWAHRLWQVLLRCCLLTASALAINKRIAPVEKRNLLVGLWILLYLFVGPLYFHLSISLLLIMIGYSPDNDRRTWVAILLASAWCGWSRVNWYPVPAMIAAVLYVFETPYKGRRLFHYLQKPALWGIGGMIMAFTFQRIYIAISGVENSNYFYTSLVSDLLWYRLLPNATFPSGIIPTAILVSFPLWIVMYLALRARKGSIHPMRMFLIFSALTALFLVGMIVSLKIGGGADLHNMDSYFILLLIVAGYLAFARYRREDGGLDAPLPLHWVVVVLLIAMPVWSRLQSNPVIITYDANRTDAVLSALQERLDQVNSQGGEILFISQRHLISMGMLHNVTLIPEYEREDLMEMAMGNNTEYLDKFWSDMESQRFALIIVDPLTFKYLGKEYSFGEENNVWVRYAMRPILCNYRQDEIFPADAIALYVPQDGERQCPKQ